MARRRREQRDAPVIAPDSSSGLFSPVRLVPYLPPPRTALQDLSDGREWHPLQKARPAPAINVNARRIMAPPLADRFGKAIRAWHGRSNAFAVPKQVAPCIRRKQRREVMFAYKRTGKGSRAFHRKRNQWSNIKC